MINSCGGIKHDKLVKYVKNKGIWHFSAALHLMVEGAEHYQTIIIWYMSGEVNKTTVNNLRSGGKVK